MNRQKIFNRVLEHAKTMNGPSYIIQDGHFPTCAYRGNDGNKCLIGAIIPDSHYCPDMEAKIVDEILTRWPEVDDCFRVRNEDDVQFLLDLQMCHDDACNNGVRFCPHSISPDVFKTQLMKNLEKFANEKGLQFNG